MVIFFFPIFIASCSFLLGKAFSIVLLNDIPIRFNWSLILSHDKNTSLLNRLFKYSKSQSFDFEVAIAFSTIAFSTFSIGI